MDPDRWWNLVEKLSAWRDPISPLFVYSPFYFGLDSYNRVASTAKVFAGELFSCPDESSFICDTKAQENPASSKELPSATLFH